ncbi:hypothetical protein Plhal304r1_c040g0117551 [Plasmopara halstedii]
MVDYCNNDELFYLGLDEVIIPDDIVWMTDWVAYRDKPIPHAFISAKTGDGVSSEGVAIFANIALRSRNIYLKVPPFTVKIYVEPMGTYLEM